MKKILISLLVVAGLGAALTWKSYSDAQRRLEIASAYRPERPDVSGRSASFKKAFLALEDTFLAQENTLTALAGLSRLYHVNGYFDEAILCYGGLLQVEPENAIWPHRLAAIYANFGQLELALPLLEKTVDLQPDYAPAWIRMGNALLKLNQVEAAEGAFQSALKFEENNPHALFGLARVGAAGGDWESVVGLLETSRRESQVDLGIDLLVTAYEKLGRERRAFSIRGEAKALSAHNELPDPWISELNDVCFDDYQLALAGGTAKYAGDVSTAIRRMRQAIKLAPKNGRHRIQLGSIYMESDRLKDALEQFNQSIRIDPTLPDAWTHSIAIHKQLGQATQAEALLESGLLHCPKAYHLLMEKGRLLQSRGLTEMSTKYFLSAAEERFDSAQPLVEAATNYFSMEQVSRGMEVLEQALSAEPDHPLALSTLALAAIGTKQESLALELLEKIETQPRVPAEDLRQLRVKFEETFAERGGSAQGRELGIRNEE